MDQPSTRTPTESVTVYCAVPRRSAPTVLRGLQRLRQLPGPRLTGLGCGILATLAMVIVGLLDEVLLGGSSIAYGLLFLLVCAACGLWVRIADLIMAPISVPIAFAAGLLPVSDGGADFARRMVGLFTHLSLQAGWLYGGTLTAVLTVALRRVLVLVDRAARRARSTARPPGRSRPGHPWP